MGGTACFSVTTANLESNRGPGTFNPENRLLSMAFAVQITASHCM